MDSNYPIVRLTGRGGRVYYARTYNWSSTSVMTGTRPVTTEFTVPLAAYADGGPFSLVVVANGISSEPVSFALSPPTGAPLLAIRLTSTNTMAVSWPWPSTGFVLQQNTNGLAALNWSNAPGAIQDDGTTRTLIVNPPTGNRFYRLKK